MIQRVQSIYLLLAGILPAFTFCLPLARFSTSDPQSYATLYGLSVQLFGQVTLASEVETPWILLAAACFCTLLPLITIFKFKNRRRQIKNAKGQLYALTVFYLVFVGYCYVLANGADVSFSLCIGSLFPLLSYAFTWLALRAIRKDEALVRSADRIR